VLNFFMAVSAEQRFQRAIILENKPKYALLCNFSRQFFEKNSIVMYSKKYFSIFVKS